MGGLLRSCNAAKEMLAGCLFLLVLVPWQQQQVGRILYGGVVEACWGGLF